MLSALKSELVRPLVTMICIKICMLHIALLRTRELSVVRRFGLSCFVTLCSCSCRYSWTRYHMPVAHT